MKLIYIFTMKILENFRKIFSAKILLDIFGRESFLYPLG